MPDISLLYQDERFRALSPQDKGKAIKNWFNKYYAADERYKSLTTQEERDKVFDNFVQKKVKPFATDFNVEISDVSTSKPIAFKPVSAKAYTEARQLVWYVPKKVPGYKGYVEQSGMTMRNLPNNRREAVVKAEEALENLEYVISKRKDMGDEERKNYSNAQKYYRNIIDFNLTGGMTAEERVAFKTGQKIGKIPFVSGVFAGINEITYSLASLLYPRSPHVKMTHALTAGIVKPGEGALNEAVGFANQVGTLAPIIGASMLKLPVLNDYIIASTITGKELQQSLDAKTTNPYAEEKVEAGQYMLDAVNGLVQAAIYRAIPKVMGKETGKILMPKTIPTNATSIKTAETSLKVLLENISTKYQFTPVLKGSLALGVAGMAAHTEDYVMDVATGKREPLPPKELAKELSTAFAHSAATGALLHGFGEGKRLYEVKKAWRGVENIASGKTVVVGQVYEQPIYARKPVINPATGKAVLDKSGKVVYGEPELIRHDYYLVNQKRLAGKLLEAKKALEEKNWTKFREMVLNKDVLGFEAIAEVPSGKITYRDYVSYLLDPRLEAPRAWLIQTALLERVIKMPKEAFKATQENVVLGRKLLPEEVKAIDKMYEENAGSDVIKTADQQVVEILKGKNQDVTVTAIEQGIPMKQSAPAPTDITKLEPIIQRIASGERPSGFTPEEAALIAKNSNYVRSQVAEALGKTVPELQDIYKNNFIDNIAKNLTQPPEPVPAPTQTAAVEEPVTSVAEIPPPAVSESAATEELPATKPASEPTEIELAEAEIESLKQQKATRLREKAKFEKKLEQYENKWDKLAEKDKDTSEIDKKIAEIEQEISYAEGDIEEFDDKINEQREIIKEAQYEAEKSAGEIASQPVPEIPEEWTRDAIASFTDDLNKSKATLERLRNAKRKGEKTKKKIATLESRVEYLTKNIKSAQSLLKEKPNAKEANTKNQKAIPEEGVQRGESGRDSLLNGKQDGKAAQNKKLRAPQTPKEKQKKEAVLKPRVGKGELKKVHDVISRMPDIAEDLKDIVRDVSEKNLVIAGKKNQLELFQPSIVFNKVLNMLDDLPPERITDIIAGKLIALSAKDYGLVHYGDYSGNVNSIKEVAKLINEAAKEYMSERIEEVKTYEETVQAKGYLETTMNIPKLSDDAKNKIRMIISPSHQEKALTLDNIKQILKEENALIMEEALPSLKDAFPDMKIEANSQVGVFMGNLEASLTIELSPKGLTPEKADIFVYRGIKLAQRFKQYSMLVVKDIDNPVDFEEPGIKRGEGSILMVSLNLDFDRQLTQEELVKITATMQEYGIVGATYLTNPSGKVVGLSALSLTSGIQETAGWLKNARLFVEQELKKDYGSRLQSSAKFHRVWSVAQEEGDIDQTYQRTEAGISQRQGQRGIEAERQIESPFTLAELRDLVGLELFEAHALRAGLSPKEYLSLEEEYIQRFQSPSERDKKQMGENYKPKADINDKFQTLIFSAGAPFQKEVYHKLYRKDRDNEPIIIDMGKPVAFKDVVGTGLKRVRAVRVKTEDEIRIILEREKRKSASLTPVSEKLKASGRDFNTLTPEEKRQVALEHNLASDTLTKGLPILRAFPAGNSETAGLSIDMDAMIDQVVNNYRGEEFIVGEIFQNSIDAEADQILMIKMRDYVSRVQLHDLAEEGTYTRVLAIDNGTGISYEEFQPYLFTVAGSGKRGQTDKAGAYGIGKCAYMLTADHVHIESVKDGWLTTLHCPQKVLRGSITGKYNLYDYMTKTKTDRLNGTVLDLIYSTNLYYLQRYANKFYQQALLGRGVMLEYFEHEISPEDKTHIDMREHLPLIDPFGEGGAEQDERGLLPRNTSMINIHYQEILNL
jgi:hypothetical protein